MKTGIFSLIGKVYTLAFWGIHNDRKYVHVGGGLHDIRFGYKALDVSVGKMHEPSVAFGPAEVAEYLLENDVNIDDVLEDFVGKSKRFSFEEYIKAAALVGN